MLEKGQPEQFAPPLSRTFQRGLPYANALPFVSLMRPLRRPERGHSPAVTKLVIEYPVTRPHVLSVCLRWKSVNLSAAICSAASRCSEASWIQAWASEGRGEGRACLPGI